jgi:hypothetical protein
LFRDIYYVLRYDLLNQAALAIDWIEVHSWAVSSVQLTARELIITLRDGMQSV